MNRDKIKFIVISAFTLILAFSCYILLGLRGLVPFYYAQCDYVGGWGRGREQSCDCFGLELTISNDLAFDGDYSTICIGKPTITYLEPESGIDSPL